MVKPSKRLEVVKYQLGSVAFLAKSLSDENRLRILLSVGDGKKPVTAIHPLETLPFPKGHGALWGCVWLVRSIHGIISFSSPFMVTGMITDHFQRKVTWT